MKKIVALCGAAVLLAWTSLTYVKLRTTRNGVLWLLPKLSAGAFSIEAALVGVTGAVLATVGRSLSVAAGYALVALAAGASVVRTWRTPEVFTGAFGPLGPAVPRRAAPLLPARAAMGRASRRGARGARAAGRPVLDTP